MHLFFMYLLQKRRALERKLSELEEEIKVKKRVNALVMYYRAYWFGFEWSVNNQQLYWIEEIKCKACQALFCFSSTSLINSILQEHK